MKFKKNEMYNPMIGLTVKPGIQNRLHLPSVYTLNIVNATKNLTLTYRVYISI